MGTWIWAIGAIIAIIVTALIYWRCSDSIGGVIVAVCAGLLVFATSFFVAANVDPVFAGDYTTVTCVECGNKMNGNDVFCSECGEKLQQEEKHCTECGGERAAKDKFCAGCGSKVKE